MTLVWIVLGVLALMLSLFVLGWLNAIRASGVRNRKLESLTRPAMEAVRENGPSAQDLVTELAEVARWLMHPNELVTAPAEMELVRRLAILGEGRSGSVFLFRFRAEPSSFASERGWMAGVAGPYWDDDESPGFASGTFSDLTPFDRLTVEQHVEFLRRASEKKGLVVPS